MSSPFTCRWGFISTGGICARVLKDMLLDPKDRDVSDVKHSVAAVASRSLDKAEAFIADNVPKEMGAKAYGSYQELFDDPNVDIVYIGTPHPQHFNNVKDALNSGKNVLCEKPFVIEAKQAKELFALAKSKNLFIMEAVWTRYQPIIEPAQKVVFGGEIGDIRRVDSRFDKDFGDLPHEHRMLNPSLAGGGLFDLGPYAMLWATLFAYQHPKNEKTSPTEIKATVRHDKRTGVDASTTWVMNYPKLEAQVTVSCSLDTPTAPVNITVTGTLGILTMHGNTPYPGSYTVTKFDAPDSAKTYDFPIKSGRGMHWELDACARCLRDGKIEEPKMPWAETIMQQEVFDDVCRSGGIVFSNDVEGI